MKQQKTTKKLEILLIALVLVLVCAISFFGIRVKDLNNWKDKLPEFEFGKELSSMRILTFSVDDSTKEAEESNTSDTDSTTIDVDQTASEDSDVSVDANKEKDSSSEEEESKEVPVNPTEILTRENYDKTKEIIETRLAKGNITDTEVTVDYDSGELSVYVPFDDADHIVDYATEQGILEIKDTDTKETVIPSENISSVSAFYRNSTQENSSDTYDIGLTLKFNKDGINKLAEVTKTYIDVIDSEGKSDPKTVDIILDGETVYTTYFDPSGTYEELNIPLYSAISNDQFDNYYDAVKIQEINLNTASLPILYKANESSYLGNTSNKKYITYGIIVFAVIVALISIRLIIKNKVKGLLAAILAIAYIAVYLLLVRYAKEALTLFSMLSIAGLSLTNYMLIVRLMNRNTKETTSVEIMSDFVLKMVPLLIVAVVFVFATSIELKSVGTVLFWGLLILLPYNIIFTFPMFNKYNELQKIGGKK